MKKTTRILSMLLALVMLVGILPVVVPTVAEAAYTPAGYYDQLPTTATDIKYLSDMTFEYSVNYGQKATQKNTQINGSSAIWLGDYTYTVSEDNKLTLTEDNRTKFTKGLGVQPVNASTSGYTVVDLADNDYKQSYFYSIAGITNANINLPSNSKIGCRFEVWASYDQSVDDYTKAEWVLLESSGTLKGCAVYQFHLDITGARYLKLVVSAVNGIACTNSAWGGTCVYNNSAYAPGGYYNQLPTTADDIVYLSDMNFEHNYNYGGKATYKDAQFNSDQAIRLGACTYPELADGMVRVGNYGRTTFTKGLGVQANSTTDPGYTVVDLADNNYKQSYFYSVAGITNHNINLYNYGCEFEVWASYDRSVEDYTEAEFVLLESSGVLKGCEVYQFHLDITGARYLKLVVNAVNGIASTNSAWGGACVYNNPGYSPKTNMFGDLTSSGNYETFADYTKYHKAFMFSDHESLFNSYFYPNLPSSKVLLATQNCAERVYHNVNTTGGKPSVGAGWVGGVPQAFDSDGGFVMNLTSGAMNGTYLHGAKDGICFAANTSINFNVRAKSVSETVDGYVTYALNGAYDTFYSLVGVANQTYKMNAYTPSNGACAGLVFEVWGDYNDGNGYQLLSASEAITQSNTGEFFVDVSGVQTLKLRIRSHDRSNAYATGVFAYASVFNRTAQDLQYSTNVTLTESLPLNFKLKQANLLSKDNLTAKITYGTQTETVNLKETDTKIKNDAAYYSFSWDKIAAKEMTNDVKITVYDGEDAISTEEVWSIQRYCQLQLEANNHVNMKLENVLVDLLNYGTAAQNYFNYNTGALANSILEGKSYSGSTTATYVADINNPVQTGSEYYYSTSVSLEETIHMNFKFKDLNDTMTATISYTDHYGNAVSKEVSIADCKTTTNDAGDTLYHVVLDELAIADCSTPVTVAIKDGEDTICTVTNNVQSYLARLKAQDSACEAVCDALMTLSTSAKAYFESTRSGITESDEENVIELNDAHQVIVTDIDNGKIHVGSLAQSGGTFTPEWTYANENLERSLSGVKFRHSDALDTDVILFTASNGLVGMVDYATGELLWSYDLDDYYAYTDEEGNALSCSPHSIELLPNGAIVVASSGGSTPANGSIAYIAMTYGDTITGEVTEANALYGAHGVTWDNERQLLWVSGSKNIEAYVVSGYTKCLNGSNTQTLTGGLAPTHKLISYTNIVPNLSGHDLMKDYSNPDHLWITDHNGVYQFDMISRELIYVYTNSSNLINLTNVKGISSFSDGVIACVSTSYDPYEGTGTNTLGSNSLVTFWPTAEGYDRVEYTTDDDSISFNKVLIADTSY